MKNPPKIELPQCLVNDREEVCRHFGCNKHLTGIEQMAGKYCKAHMGKVKIDIMKVLKFR